MASSGTWFDTKSGKVVTSQPEEGVQLVAPGVEPTAADEVRVARYKGELDDEDKTVSTKTTTAKK